MRYCSQLQMKRTAEYNILRSKKDYEIQEKSRFIDGWNGRGSQCYRLWQSGKTW